MRIAKGKIRAVLCIVAVLAGAFWWGGNAPGLRGWSTGTPDSNAAEPLQADPKEVEATKDEPSAEAPTTKPEQGLESKPEEQKPAQQEPEKPKEPEKEAGMVARPGGSEGGMSATEKVKAAAEIAEDSSAGAPTGSETYSEKQGMKIDASTGKDKYQTDPVPEGKPVPVESQDVQVTDVAQSCTLSVRCDTILKNMDWLDPDKTELVPEDGVIFASSEVTFYEGESVFNLLQREMKKAKIHMEFVNTPIYNSAYIEGIHNLYEFDCGELSGWMYKVNGWFPNYGCSRYQLKAGDKVEWVYTCDLGVDVGGYSAAAGS